MDIRDHLKQPPMLSKESLVALYKSRAAFIDNTKEIFANSLAAIHQRVLDDLKFSETQDETMEFYICYLNDFISVEKPTYQFFNLLKKSL